MSLLASCIIAGIRSTVDILSSREVITNLEVIGLDNAVVLRICYRVIMHMICDLCVVASAQVSTNPDYTISVILFLPFVRACVRVNLFLCGFLRDGSSMCTSSGVN